MSQVLGGGERERERERDDKCVPATWSKMLRPTMACLRALKSEG
jgi:hypothetical protein